MWYASFQVDQINTHKIRVKIVDVRFSVLNALHDYLKECFLVLFLNMCKVIGTPILYLMPFIDNSGKMSQSIIWTFYLFFFTNKKKHIYAALQSDYVNGG